MAKKKPRLYATGPKPKPNRIRNASGRALHNEDYEAALSIRCKHAGIKASADGLKEARHPAYGHWAGVELIRISGNDRDTWGPLWDAICRTATIIARYEAAIDAPKRHGNAPRQLLPLPAFETGGEDSHVDLRTKDERDIDAIRAYARLRLSLAGVDSAVVSDYIAAACDGLRVDIRSVIIGAGAVARAC